MDGFVNFWIDIVISAKKIEAKCRWKYDNIVFNGQSDDQSNSKNGSSIDGKLLAGDNAGACLLHWTTSVWAVAFNNRWASIYYIIDTANGTELFKFKSDTAIESTAAGHLVEPVKYTNKAPACHIAIINLVNTKANYTMGPTNATANLSMEPSDATANFSVESTDTAPN